MQVKLFLKVQGYQPQSPKQKDEVMSTIAGCRKLGSQAWSTCCLSGYLPSPRVGLEEIL